jgi:hypothetical protein
MSLLSWVPFYPLWKNKPDKTTPISAAALTNYDDFLADVAAVVNGMVQVVEPEQFPGATDDVQFANALAAVAVNGGVIRLRPGKVYNWVNAIPTFDVAQYGKRVVILAWGAVVNCNVAGSSWIIKKSIAGASPRAIACYGGEWNNTNSGATEFFLMQDVERTFWFGMMINVPSGSGWHMSNVQFFSENNHWEEIYDPGCKHLFTTSNDGSVHLSMARTVWRTINVQGGVDGEPKINIGDNTSLYSGILDGLTGNLATNAIGIRLGGNMHGFVICGNIGLENSVGTTGVDYSYYFTVGTMLGGIPPHLHSDIPNDVTMKFMHPGSSQVDLYGAVIALGKMPGVLGVGDDAPFDLPSPITLPTTTETAVFTIPVAAGEYILHASINCTSTTVSTVANFQARVNPSFAGSTATFTMTGKSATQITTPSNASVNQQTNDAAIRCHLYVTVAGNIVVTARASQPGQANSQTPASSYNNASGYTLEQVA